MPLPKLVTPEFTITVPSTKEPVKIRPFLVKEEKIHIPQFVKILDYLCLLHRLMKINVF